MNEFGRSTGVSSVTEKERKSRREVGETRRYTWGMPIGMYREIAHISETEGMSFPKALLLVCRKGIQRWREEQRKGEQ